MIVSELKTPNNVFGLSMPMLPPNEMRLTQLCQVMNRVDKSLKLQFNFLN